METDGLSSANVENMASDCTERLGYSPNTVHYNIITMIWSNHILHIWAAEGRDFAGRHMVESVHS